MSRYPKGAKQRFLQLVFSYGQLTKEPVYSKDEVIEIMKNEFNMTVGDIASMAKSMHNSNKIVLDALADISSERSSGSR